MRVALNACFAPESLCGKGSLYLFQHCLFGGADRKANINTAGEHAVFYVEHAANAGEGTGFCVSTGNAQTAAVGAAVGEQLCQSLAVGKGGIAAQIGQQPGNGVVAAFRPCRRVCFPGG